jgi:hypothetical protein
MCCHLPPCHPGSGSGRNVRCQVGAHKADVCSMATGQGSRGHRCGRLEANRPRRTPPSQYSAGERAEAGSRAGFFHLLEKTKEA